MPRPQKLRQAPRNQPRGCCGTSGSWCPSQRIHLYGWDSRAQIWHGPTELATSSAASDKRLVQALSATSGKSWYGPINCCTAGEPAARFFTMIHDLSDCAVAAIYCGESKAGPAEILTVIPANRRAALREEFAFEFLAFARFLGSISGGDELQVHEAMSAAIASEKASTSCVFSFSSGLLPADLDPALSCCAEKVAVALCRWLAESAPPSPQIGGAPRPDPPIGRAVA